jgi:DNA-binding NtrC family response regulator
MLLRYHHPDPPADPPADPPVEDVRGDRPSRLNLLLSYGGWRETPAVEQLSHLLAPLGIDSFNADSGEEAAEIIRQVSIHIAIVDVDIPFAGAERTPAGGRIIQLLRRLEPAPPTVIVRPPQPASRENVRGLAHALREGAFAVLDRPVNLETMLEVMRRVLKRHYAGHWPKAG